MILQSLVNNAHLQNVMIMKHGSSALQPPQNEVNYHDKAENRVQSFDTITLV